MRILYESEGQQREGQTRALDTLGTTISTQQQPTIAQSVIQLQLDTGSEMLHLSGEVLQVNPDGFSVIFSAMHPDTLARLDHLLHPDKQPVSEPQSVPREQDGERQLIDLVDDDWSPPVSEPVLHDWKPEKELIQPPEHGAMAQDWKTLPTITPAEPPPQAPPAEANRPPAAVQQNPPAFASPPQPAEQRQPTAAPPAQQPASTAVPARTEPAAAANRREAERFDQSIPVSFDNLTSLIKEFTHNISYGGMFVYTDRVLERNSQCVVTLVHPVHGERLSLPTKVVHSNPAPSPDPVTGAPRYGMGLEFQLPLNELKKQLSDFISSHQSTQAASAGAGIVAEAKAILEKAQSKPHAILGVPEGASQNDIRKAYFERVDRFHPDRYFGKVDQAERRVLEDLFRQLTKAYESLASQQSG